MANDTTRPTYETIRSLQRELAEAREHAKEARQALTSIRAAVDADLGLERASNEAPVEVNTELYRTKILDATAALKSLASLTPLTDPSVRGVLVACSMFDVEGFGLDGIFGIKGRFKLRPASEFGVDQSSSPTNRALETYKRGRKLVDENVSLQSELRIARETISNYAEKLRAARGEPGLKKLPEGAIVFTPRMPGDKGCVMYLGKWFKEHAGHSYGIPDGVADSSDLQAERDQLDVMCHEGAARCERLAERIKELEAELADWKADTTDQLCVNCSDPLEYQGRADAAAVADAERLRKAIETHQRTLNPTGDGAVNEVHNKLWSALSPSPAAASGDWLNKMADAEDAAGDISIGTSAPAAESDPADADSLYVEAMTDAIKRAISAPAEESEGSAQYHSEGAKIPEGGSGSSAAESEGGEREIADILNALRNVIGVRDEQVDRAMRLLASLADQRDALSARLAACEERCKELEDGIRSHQDMRSKWTMVTPADKRLWSLLAPKAGGEDAVD